MRRKIAYIVHSRTDHQWVGKDTDTGKLTLVHGFAGSHAFKTEKAAMTALDKMEKQSPLSFCISYTEI